MANMAQAIRMALHYAETHLDLKHIFGQDVGPPLGGIFTATQGLKTTWNSPLDERGILGAAMGLAFAKQRCVAEIQFCDYIFNTIDLLKLAGNTCWASHGDWHLPMTIMTPVGSGIRGSIYHSHSFDATMTHIPGWKTVMPSTPQDAYGLMIACLKDPNPTMFLIPKALIYLQGEDLRFYETLVVYIDKSASLIEEDFEIPVVSSKGRDFESRINTFKSQALRQTSSWRVYMSVANNINVSVNTFGKKKIFVSFGELNAEITSSDFLFTLEPRKHNVVIPREVFWSKYDLYTPNARLCICKLIQADFHSADNVYYKTIISNIMNMSSFPKRKKTDLRNFRSPLGRQLHKYWMIDPKSHLPVFRN